MPRGRTMRVISINMPEWMLEEVEKARKKLGLMNKSDFIRYSVRVMLMEVLKDENDKR